MNTNQMSIPAISCGHCKMTVEREVALYRMLRKGGNDASVGLEYRL